jgi:hypothetical protein
LTLSAKQSGHRAKWPNPRKSIGARRRFPAAQGLQIGITGKSIADNLSKSGWSWGCVSALTMMDAQFGSLTRTVKENVSLCGVDEKLRAFVELEAAICVCGELA